MSKQNNNKRKIAITVLAGLAATGLIGASAASLGGISNQGLGADAEVVASCDTDGVSVSYDTSYAGSETIHVDDVTIGQVNVACATLDYEVQLYAADDTVLGEQSGTVVLTPAIVLPPDPIGNNEFTVDFAADDVDAELVEGIAITITGND